MKYKVGDLLGMKNRDTLWLVQSRTKEKMTLLCQEENQTWTDLICNIEIYKFLYKLN